MTEGGDPDAIEVDPEQLNASVLDQSFVAYIECVEPILDGHIRLNPQRFTSIEGEFGLEDGRDDEQLLSRLESECAIVSRFDDIVSAYESQPRVDRDQIMEIVGEAQACLEGVGLDGAAAELGGSEIVGVGELLQARNAIPYQEAEDPLALLDCVDTAVYGPKTEF